MTDNGYYDYPASAFTPGARVEIHPATDWFARGCRYGTVVKAGRTRVTVKFDRLAMPLGLPATYLRPVDGAP
jgi:hypothetical protein